jgi:Zn-dependent protease
MQKGWQFGNILGIPLYIDQSWLWIFFLFTYFNVQDFQRILPQSSTGIIWISGFSATMLLFLSVLLHELGHSIAAISQGIKVNSITLFMFGGVAAIEKESNTPENAFQIAIAGPLVSLMLFFGLKLLAEKTTFAPIFSYIIKDTSDINLVLAIFNMIPGLPLDGGQVLKAIVWKITGNPFKGVKVAAKTGQILGWIGVIYGLFMFLNTKSLSPLWTVFIGGFILDNASKYEKLSNIQEALTQIKAEDIMTRDFQIIDANMNLRTFADQYILAETWQHSSQPTYYYAVSNGRYRGLVKVEKMQFIERSQWESQTVYDLVHSLDEIVTVQEKTPLVEIINCLEINEIPTVTVLSPAETIAGIIDKGDIVKGLANKMQWNIPEQEIKRIKAEGTYPEVLPLPLLAKSM